VEVLFARTGQLHRTVGAWGATLLDRVPTIVLEQSTVTIIGVLGNTARQPSVRLWLRKCWGETSLRWPHDPDNRVVIVKVT
jgi:hypothetical protein